MNVIFISNFIHSDVFQTEKRIYFDEPISDEI